MKGHNFWNFSVPLLEDTLKSIIDALREPAGSKWKSLDEIESNKSSFVRDFHRGLFVIHLMAIDGIIHCESKIGTVTKKDEILWKIQAQLFRKINDTIYWRALRKEQGYLAARLCRDRDRGRLAVQNPKSAITVMKTFMENPDLLVLWNDACGFPDIADITVFHPQSNSVTFLELKEGKVNEEILDIIRSDFNEKKVEAFKNKYPKKGVQQLERVVRQIKNKALHEDIVRNEDVFDSFRNKQRKAHDFTEHTKHYDKELGQALVQARGEAAVSLEIDNCMKILILNRSLDQTPQEDLIIKHLRQSSDRTIYTFQDGLWGRTTMPPFLWVYDRNGLSSVNMLSAACFFCWLLHPSSIQMSSGFLTLSIIAKQDCSTQLIACGG